MHYDSLEGSGKAVFVALVLMGLIPLIYDCAPVSLPKPPDASLLLIEGYITVLTGGVLAYSLAAFESQTPFALALITFMVAIGPFVAATWGMPKWGLGAIILIILYLVLELSDTRATASNVVCAIWITISILLTLGKYGVIPYYEWTDEVAKEFGVNAEYLRKWLDVRFISGFVLIVQFMYKAVSQTARMDVPTITGVPQVGQLPSLFSEPQNPVLHAMLEPIVVSVNLVVGMTVKLVDLVWRTGATMSVYLYRVAKVLSDEIVATIINTKLWSVTAKCLAASAMCYAFAGELKTIALHAAEYLRANSYYEFVWLVGVFVLCVVGVGMEIMILNEKVDIKEQTPPLAFAATMSVVAMFCTGVAGHVVARVYALSGQELRGYDHIGPFMLVVGGVFAVVAVGVIGRRVITKQ